MILRTLTPFLSLIIAVLLFFFVIQPQYTEITTIQSDTNEYVKATEGYQEFTRVLDEKLMEKQSRSTLDNERLDAFVPSTIEPTQLLVDLEAMAGRHNLLFGNISVDESDVDFSKAGEKQVSSELTTADISFEVIGSYGQLKGFLGDLERSITLFEVVNLKFTVSEETLFGQYAITVRTYALPKS